MSVLESVIAVIAPHECQVCSRQGHLLCNACQKSTLVPVSLRCYRCRGLSPTGQICNDCSQKTGLERVWAACDYNQVARQLIAALKFGYARAAAKDVARTMAATLPHLPRTTVMVFVPTATSRVRQRGYDHACLVSQELARNTGCRSIRALGRTGQTRQVGANRLDRQRQMSQAFYVRHDVAGLDVLLVDDVLTTGATLEAAAKTLRRAGAKSVMAVVFAEKQ